MAKTDNVTIGALFGVIVITLSVCSALSSNRENVPTAEEHVKLYQDINGDKESIQEDIKRGVERLAIPGIIPNVEDIYLCTGAEIDADTVIEAVDPAVDSDIVNHASLIGCPSAPAADQQVWVCRNDNDVCGSSPSVVIYSWARHGKGVPFEKPARVSDVGVEYVVLRVHYDDMSEVPDSSGVAIEYTVDDVDEEPEEASDEEVEDIVAQLQRLKSPENPENINFMRHLINDVLSSEGDEVLKQVVSWPEQDEGLGQVSGLDVCPGDHLWAFHRGEHEWLDDTFDADNIYTKDRDSAIDVDTVVELDQETGAVLKGWGNHTFYLPHGLTIDEEMNFWLTDVALHQVFKYDHTGSTQLMVLGERFVPGGDHQHFCKPTDVAVHEKSGDFFVADGYCNNRILRFNKEGEVIDVWESKKGDDDGGKAFNVPHSLAMIVDHNALCVADRENGRIQCFDVDSGELVKSFKNGILGGRVFAIAYNPVVGFLYAVNGEQIDNKDVVGMIIDYNTGDQRYCNQIGECNELVFKPSVGKFVMPHDLAVSKDGEKVYVGDAKADDIVKFESN